MMEQMSRFTSATIAGGANQTWFETNGTPCTGRVFYRIDAGGTYRYALRFGDTIDSTFADGSVSRAQMTLGGWTIECAAVGRVPANMTDFARCEPTMQPLTFDGCPHKTVAAGERFISDAVTLTFEKHDYLCLEMTVSGGRLPCHAESVLPVYRRQGDKWVYDTAFPLPAMVGCDRAVSRRVGFFGDSITQGIGTPVNSYAHWSALVADWLVDRYACHNIGIGYGRASDAALGGVWMDKALENDIVFVCFGVNDLLHGATAERVIADLNAIVDRLIAADKTVILQTVPPFDYAPETAAHWRAVNRYILDELRGRVATVFDVVPILGEDEAPHRARYGGHPNAEGCRLWATALLDHLRQQGLF